ncbi:hypothetical protein KGF54_005223 [Candida jiufengensis]|uniref:uncharacterized protein n=1 Tax=Candida jiufengensis TaxID=497108 RepID=UPI0022248A2D|nr:uncharacterized protein KGF54_005223 [Candida jiufengensis]KAI5950266.1 hypothetical protein KGF54_005223 [Candida jiufengensis]
MFVNPKTPILEAIIDDETSPSSIANPTGTDNSNVSIIEEVAETVEESGENTDNVAAPSSSSDGNDTDPNQALIKTLDVLNSTDSSADSGPELDLGSSYKSKEDLLYSQLAAQIEKIVRQEKLIDILISNLTLLIEKVKVNDGKILSLT